MPCVALLCEVASLRNTSLVRSRAFLYHESMYFVYILKSQKDGSSYKGVTTDLEKRLKQHNSIKNRYTSNKQPFEIIWYCNFKDKIKAYSFEKYLKSGSGFAFAKKRLI